MVIFVIVCCYGNSLQYTHMDEKEIPGVWLIFTVNTGSLNPNLTQIVHFQFSILLLVVNTVRSHLKAIFRIRENILCTKFLSLLYMRSLAYKISHYLSANHNPELRCVICAGVTLFALVLHLNCTALSQSESSNLLCVLLTFKSSKTSFLARPSDAKIYSTVIAGIH